MTCRANTDSNELLVFKQFSVLFVIVHVKVVVDKDRTGLM